MEVGDSINIPNLSNYSFLIIVSLIDGNWKTIIVTSAGSYSVTTSHWAPDGFYGCWKFTLNIGNDKFTLSEGFDYGQNSVSNLYGVGPTYFQLKYIIGII